MIIGIGRELIGRWKDGSTFPMQFSLSEVWLNNQWFFTGIIRDISKRKQAEQALARIEAQLRAVLETANQLQFQVQHVVLGVSSQDT